MNESEPNQLQDDDAIEIISLDAVGHSPNRRWQWLQRVASSTRQRRIILRLAVGFACVLLAIVLIQGNLSSLPTLPFGAGAQDGLISAPAANFIPAYGSFYIDVSLPWAHVSLDGHPLFLPRVGIDPPLRLGRGHHLISWQAAPFETQACQISVPIVASDTCSFASDELVQQGSAQVLALHSALDALPLAQRDALLVAAQAALNRADASQKVQPGELYAGPNGYVVASQPLLATLHFQLDVFGKLNRTYIIAGQECEQFCVIPWQPFLAHDANPAVNEWLALAFITSSWSYAIGDGHVVAQNQPIDLQGDAGVPYPILMRVAWNGSSWQVEALIGPNQVPPIIMNRGLPQFPIHPSDKIQVADDPACAAARNLLAGDILDLPQKRFISAPNPATGCLAVTVSSQTNTPGMPGVALYFEHFGVLLAANSFAHKLMPYLPLADPAEQALARQLQAYPGQIVSSP